jgi:hypothetical protein
MNELKIKNSVVLEGGITLSGDISGANVINAQQIFVNGIPVALSGQIFGSFLANIKDADDGGVLVGDVDNNIATGKYAIAGGKNTKAYGDGSYAGGWTYGVGGKIIAVGAGSRAQGWVSGTGTIGASGEGTRAEGIAYGSGTIGVDKNAYGSRAEGYVSDNGSVKAFGIGSRTEGFATDGGIITTGTDGHGSHAEGFTVAGVIRADGLGSHAEGYAGSGISIIASGRGSRAEGTNTLASQDFTHAGGAGARAVHSNSFVWSDGTVFSSQASKTFNIYATNGVHISGGSLNVKSVNISGGLLNILGTGTQYSGVNIIRGAQPTFQMVFDEAVDVFKVGQVGSLQTIATRTETIANNQMVIYDSNTKSLSGAGFTKNDVVLFNNITYPALSGALDPHYVKYTGDTYVRLTGDTMQGELITEALTVGGGNPFKIVDLNTGNKLLTTDNTGIVAESPLEVLSSPTGGSGFSVIEYSNTPNLTNNELGFIWVQAVDSYNKKLCYYDGTNIFSVQLYKE